LGGIAGITMGWAVGMVAVALDIAMIYSWVPRGQSLQHGQGFPCSARGEKEWLKKPQT